MKSYILQMYMAALFKGWMTRSPNFLTNYILVILIMNKYVSIGRVGETTATYCRP